MQKDQIRQLLAQYINGELSATAEEELTALIQPGSENAVIEVLNELIAEEAILAPAVPSAQLLSSLKNVLQVDKPGIPVAPVVSMRRTWLRWVAAAVFVIAVGTAVLLLNNKPVQRNDAATTRTDVPAPGNTKATIILANGHKLYLDSVGNGQLAMQGNVKLVKLANGQIAYETASGEIIKEASYNTLFNPRGSKVIDMLLADGSRVWLNAGSSITYPVAFTGKERKVSITGEAYFEVAHNAAMPFYVSKGDVQVQVLGTHFNVNAYDDEEALKVTLLEGAVRITSSQQSALLKPGEQAAVTMKYELQISNNINLEQVMAWKNGLFNFEDAGLRQVLRQLQRWYDIDVVYEGDVPDIQFFGKMDKNVPLSLVLTTLQADNVHFHMNGRTLTVTK